MKIIKKILPFFLLLAFFACSDDSEPSNDFEQVPSGEIVAVELRNKVLTGLDQSLEAKSVSATQKWWTHVITKVDVNKTECGESFSIEEIGYFAFYNSGELYVKSVKGDTPKKGGTWSWVSDKKDKINVYIQALGKSQDFTLTYLNEDNVVYASKQAKGPCSAITYEQFNAPFFE